MCNNVVVIIGFCVLLISVNAKAQENIKINETKVTPKIVGGEIVKNRSELAYQVSIRYFGKHHCGGALVDNHNVLTAAHCCFFTRTRTVLPPGSLEVVFGDLKLTPSSEMTVRKKVYRIIPHEKYNMNTYENDIAVLKFSDPFTNWTDYIRPIAISELLPKAGTKCVVSGWGRIMEGGNLSNDLQKASVPIISYSQCKKSYSSYIKAGMFCAGYLNGGKDACQGDSGGPLVSSTPNNTLVGIVSWGYGCAKPNYPGVYTDISYYYDWIIRAVNGNTKITLLPHLTIICISILKLV